MQPPPPAPPAVPPARAISPRLDLLGLLGFVALCAAVAAGGGWLTALSVNDWYAGLKKPPFNPTDAAFGPVWTVLFGMMALAAWLVWRSAAGPAHGCP